MYIHCAYKGEIRDYGDGPQKIETRVKAPEK